MAIEYGLRDLLLGQLSITALVPPQTIDGTNYGRVFNETPKRKIIPPYILIHVMSENTLNDLAGAHDLKETDFDIDCYAVLPEDATAIKDRVFAFLEPYRGPAGASDTIKAVIYRTRRHDYVQEAQGRDVQHYIESMSFTIQHQ